MPDVFRVAQWLVRDPNFGGRSDTGNAAGLHFGHYALFVVSDLPGADNITLAKKIAPAIRLHTEKLRA